MDSQKKHPSKFVVAIVGFILAYSYSCYNVNCIYVSISLYMYMCYMYIYAYTHCTCTHLHLHLITYFFLDVVCHTFSGRLNKYGLVGPSWKENDRFYGKGSWLFLQAVVLHGRPATGLPCGCALPGQYFWIETRQQSWFCVILQFEI